MPVVGHAFVGLATAVQFEPAAQRDGRPLTPLAAASWAPALVVLAYLPDIVTQAGTMAGWAHAGLLGHSLLFGAAAGVAIGLVWARGTGASVRFMVAVCAGTLLAHDLFDLCQDTDRAPFWPWSHRIVTTTRPLIPSGIAAEGLLFAFAFGVYIAWRLWTGRGLGALTRPASARLRPASRWTLVATAVAVTLAALVTHSVRERLEHQLDRAEALVDAGAYADALDAANAADSSWVSTVKPGRVDLVRAEAYAGMGDGARAEALYRRAYDADPTNFWAAVDIAEFYAGCDRPAAERRALVQPYLDRLRTEFSAHRELPAIVARIEQALAPAE